MKIIWTRWHKYCNVTIVKMNCTRDQTWYVKLLFIHFWIHQIMSAWVCVCSITFSKVGLILAIMWDSGFLFQSWCFYNFLWSDCLVCVCASQAQMGRLVFLIIGAETDIFCSPILSMLALRLPSASIFSCICLFWWPSVVVRSEPTLVSFRLNSLHTGFSTDQLLFEQFFLLTSNYFQLFMFPYP